MTQKPYHALLFATGELTVFANSMNGTLPKIDCDWLQLLVDALIAKHPGVDFSEIEFQLYGYKFHVENGQVKLQ